ncbi:uncharacterized protein LOC130992781 [Salvia miltiorrhiza]|uniref:uncharacterized protein LOC130992781 n=1 Tax=Salvia miltiorrhiza TaxID=226208 RepID=UPI0025AC3341|nr:uncharacterized protein LOC130992781 [Salvia miltiorrhiza]
MYTLLNFRRILRENKPAHQSRRQKKVSSKRQCPVINDVNYSTGSMRSIHLELTPYPPKLIQDDIGHADAVCLDGSPPSYAYHQGFESGSKSRVVFMEVTFHRKAKQVTFHRKNLQKLERGC